MSRHPAHLPDERTFGQRAADRVSSACGSWRFIWGYVALTTIWCGGNIGVWHFDAYPYQFYTFSVSVLAILMSSLILLAGNRQLETDRLHAENAYHHVDEINTKQDEQLAHLAALLKRGESQHQEILAKLERLIQSHS